MKSYNIEHNKARAGIIGSNIVIMYKAVHGHVTSIKCAPNRYALKVFGGKLSIEEFRKMTQSGTRVLVSMPDHVHHIQDVVLKNDIKALSDFEMNNKFQEISRSSTTTNETLKIKRQKPLKRDVNNLETTLGITRKK
jgi:hypothetical protein